MKPLLADPNRLIPWHSPRNPLGKLKELAKEEKALRAKNPNWQQQELDRITRYIQGDYIYYPSNTPGWQGVPPIPLLSVANPIANAGYYNLYEGHHRTTAALQTDLLLPAYLVENDEDIAFLIRIGGNIEHGQNPSFSTHRDLVYKLTETYYAYEMG
ncbi:MAG: hypothetical protein AABX70_04970 [Nanoarchaeota archaeon]